MSLINTLRKDKMKAMKEKNRVKTGVISLIMNNILMEEKTKKRELTDEEALTFVQKELKQTKDALAQVPEDRIDQIEENKKKIEIILEYLPKQMSDCEIEQEIQKILEEEKLEKSPASIGIIMKKMMGHHKGEVDGKRVNEILRKVLER
ncbi:MAG: GatB/YqeY domain-containing protein [Tissierellia bacterium]|nr:GatB/YqeY domain-containing protein [Tissierellia bacterium]